jgi:hypothetical protein
LRSAAALALPSASRSVPDPWDSPSGSFWAYSPAASREDDSIRARVDAHRHTPAFRMAIADKKAFLLRLDPAVWVVLERLAQAELRSVNAQIEFMLRNALDHRPAAPKRRAPK